MGRARALISLLLIKPSGKKFKSRYAYVKLVYVYSYVISSTAKTLFNQ